MIRQLKCSEVTMKKNTIGTDPEFFIKDKSGKYINAENMFPGSKDAPHMMKSGAGLQTDNVAVEFASPVSSDGADLVRKLRATFHELYESIPENMELDLSPSAIFDEDQLQTEQAQLFGCSPSYCAWEVAEKEPPNAERSPLRSIGGHVHIGTTNDDNNDFLKTHEGKINTVRMCDAFLGIISVVLDNSEEAKERRKLYGKAGDHRPTEYGVEYRTLSSFWLKSPDLVMLIDSLVTDVLKVVREKKYDKIIKRLEGPEKIQNIINENDYNAAIEAVDNVLIYYMSDNSIELFSICRQRMESYDFTTEWSIKRGVI